MNHVQPQASHGHREPGLNGEKTAPASACESGRFDKTHVRRREPEPCRCARRDEDDELILVVDRGERTNELGDIRLQPAIAPIRNGNRVDSYPQAALQKLRSPRSGETKQRPGISAIET